MIIDEVELILESDDSAQLLNRLVDDFRVGRDAAELMELLHSDSDELIRIGTWILTEIPISKYDDEAFGDRLHELTQHPNSAIRLHALSALFPFLVAGTPTTRELITRMREDPNDGVRMAAEAAASRMGIV